MTDEDHSGQASTTASSAGLFAVGVAFLAIAVTSSNWAFLAIAIVFVSLGVTKRGAADSDE
ncbi:MAG: hypothetical protein ACFCVC_17090 [Acidimicrobiia bacterium]